MRHEAVGSFLWIIRVFQAIWDVIGHSERIQGAEWRFIWPCWGLWKLLFTYLIHLNGIVFNQNMRNLHIVGTWDQKILGAGLNKTRRNSNWEERPLSPNQVTNFENECDLSVSFIFRDAWKCCYNYNYWSYCSLNMLLWMLLFLFTFSNTFEIILSLLLSKGMTKLSGNLI